MGRAQVPPRSPGPGHAPRGAADGLGLVLIGLLLTGYALLSKGFAYLGAPPAYIGEIVLATCVALFLTRPVSYLSGLSATGWLVVAFCALCLLRTLPDLPRFGLLALRDGVVYGYAVFGGLIAIAMAREDRVRGLLPAYEWASALVVVASPLVILTMRPPGEETAHVPLLFQKAGDLSVHLVGAASFRLVGLAGGGARHRAGPRRLLALLFWPCWLFCAAWAVSVGRGALLTIACGVTIMFCFGYGRRAILVCGGALICAFLVLAAFQISIGHGKGRRISAEQVVANTLSIVDDVGPADDRQVNTRALRDNAQWRLRWWSRIIDKSVQGGEAWTGRGFGANIVAAYGVIVGARSGLRSPHSIHMTILARTGFPGLALWLALLAALFSALIRQAILMRRGGNAGWFALNVWIGAYCLGSLVNGSFDVYLEGPQGGIWFWSLVGLAVAVTDLERRVIWGGRRRARPLAPAPFAAPLPA